MSRRLDCVPLSQLRVSADLPHTQLALPLSFCLYLPNIRTLLPFLCANNRENQHSILQSIIYCIIYYFLLKIQNSSRFARKRRTETERRCRRGAAGAVRFSPAPPAPHGRVLWEPCSHAVGPNDGPGRRATLAMAGRISLCRPPFSLLRLRAWPAVPAPTADCRRGHCSVLLLRCSPVLQQCPSVPVGSPP